MNNHDNEREYHLMILKMLAIMAGLFCLLVMLSSAAEAKDDGLLTYAQCLKVEQMSGNPCIHKTPIFFTFGIGKTPVSGKQKDDPPRTEGGNNWSAGTQIDGALYRVARNKTVYNMDGSPRQCTDPCRPCDGGYCKYRVEGDGTFYWVRVNGH